MRALFRQFAKLRKLGYALVMDINDCKTAGQLIQALLADREWNQRTLAIVLGMDETGVNRLVSDKRPVTAELALALEDVFRVPAVRFLDLQTSYDLGRARMVARHDPKRATRAHLFGGLPVAEMIKRRWLPDVESIKDVPTVEAALAKFFGVQSVDEIEILPHAAKKTQVAGDVTPTQLAWLYRVKEIADEMIAPRYSPDALSAAIPKLSNLLSAAEEARKVPRILTEAGVRFIIVESLPSAKIDGVCFWLNEGPVIAMSLRHDRIDNFWFVLRHEIEHALRQHGRVVAILDAEIEEKQASPPTAIAKEERMASEAAADFCVPKDQMERFIARKAPFFAERDIIGFATTLRIHPGLVAGQLQHVTHRYDLFRKHLVKIRSAIRPSAIVDGWGDVAPVGI